MNSARRTTRVVVVEDSAVQRAHLTRILQADGDIELVAGTATADEAIEVVRRTRPDVVTMDLHIPGGGIAAITEIMRTSPIPILVFSTAVGRAGSTAAVDALAAGAVDALPKPARWDKTAETTLRDRVRALGRVRGLPAVHRPPPQHATTAERADQAHAIVAIGASTGGPAALAQLLPELTVIAAPILVVQHLHADFVESFVTWIARAMPTPVVLAEDGMQPRAGVVYVAPADRHLQLGAPGNDSWPGPLLLETKPRLLHRPSVTQLFNSVAAHGGRAAIGVVLTGMGDDGAKGLLAMREAGAHTFAQDEESSVVFGMPRAAIQCGAALEVRPLGELAAAIAQAVRQVRR